jgi:hypothetical protein
MATEIVKGIFQLEVDHTNLDAGLKAVASQYAKVTTEVNKQNDKLKALTDQETKLLDARKKSNNPTYITQYDNELKKVRAEITAITAKTVELAGAEKKAGDEATKLGQQMSKAFNKTAISAATNQIKQADKELQEVNKTAGKTEESVKKTTNSFTKLRQDIKAAKGELQQALDVGDEDQIQAATIKVGILQDKFNDLNESAKAFASGSKFQVVGNLLGNIGSNILALDFDRAREQSEALLKVSQTITFKETIEGVKSLGATFANLATAILGNPLFLLAALITGIAVAYNFWNDNLSENAVRIRNATAELEKQKIVNELVIAQIERSIALAEAQGASEEKILKLKKQKALFEIAEVQRSIALNKAKLDEIKTNDTLFESYLKLFAITEKAVGLDKIAADTAKQFDQEKKVRSKEVNEALAKDVNKLLDIQNGIAVEEAKINKKRTDNAKKAAEDRRNAELEELNKSLDDERRREKSIRDAVAIANKQKEADEELLASERAKRLEELKDLRLKVEKEEAEAFAANEERLKKQREERKQAAIKGFQDVSNAAFDFANQQVQFAIDTNDRLIAVQEGRVSDAKKIAEKGNAQFLELEQKRLEDLQKQRQQFVNRQQALAQVELAINAAVAVSKAAAEGGAAAPFTIAATLIALLAGLVKARQIASQGFYEGGMFEGYTGEGDPRSESMAVGKKPYIYHKKEFIFNHKTTNKYKDIFEGIHKGRIDLNEWRAKAEAIDVMRQAQGAGLAQSAMPVFAGSDNSDIKREIAKLTGVVKRQTMYMSVDGNGFNMYLKNIEGRTEFIKRKAKP